MRHLNTKFFIVMACGICFTGVSVCAPVVNKSAKFQVQSNSTASSSGGNSAIAEQIRAQRAALDARDAQDITTTKLKSGATKNTCDNAIRKCIESKCGANYEKCATDTDITFSDKLNACNKNSGCTAHEFTILSTQFKEDKKQAVVLSAYNETIRCGNAYNDCIITECGQKFTKCLSKSAGDKAIAKCKQIATDCTEADSAMAGRIGKIFGTVRQNEEIQIAEDEKKLRTLRQDMRASCGTLGALFDDRSLDCVFTAEFFTGDDIQTPKASKKLYAGSAFDCSPDWFGIDITTFKENAFRETRAQTAASAAMLGSGVGTAVGAITSGAINRAIDTQNAKKELENACEKNGQILDKNECRDMTEAEKKLADEKKKAKEEKIARKAERKCLVRAGKKAVREGIASGFTGTDFDGDDAAENAGECLKWDDEKDEFSGQSIAGKAVAKKFNENGITPKDRAQDETQQ